MTSKLPHDRIGLVASTTALCAIAALAGAAAGRLAPGAFSPEGCAVAQAHTNGRVPSPTLGLPIDHSVMEHAPDDPEVPAGLSIGL